MRQTVHRSQLPFQGRVGSGALDEGARSRAGRQGNQTGAQAKPAATPGASARHAGPSPAQALRCSGWRAIGPPPRTLARWTAHPDQDKKGVVLPDVVAEEFVRFNPPKNQ